MPHDPEMKTAPSLVEFGFVCPWKINDLDPAHQTEKKVPIAAWMMCT